MTHTNLYSNKSKHGISLEEAKKLWFVPAIEIQARTVGEQRFMIIGKIKRVSIDFTKNILDEVDIEAAKIGVTRTALIKMWVAEHIRVYTSHG